MQGGSTKSGKATRERKRNAMEGAAAAILLGNAQPMVAGAGGEFHLGRARGVVQCKDCKPRVVYSGSRASGGMHPPTPEEEPPASAQDMRDFPTFARDQMLAEALDGGDFVRGGHTSP
eukprot:jgi/Tetstr1/434516/TSEL_023608.t1